MLTRWIHSGLLSALTALLIACGGGGGGTASVPAPPPSLSGIAAVGAAMKNAKVSLKDSNGKTDLTTADDNGNFKFSNVGGFTPPLMLRAATDNGTALHSLLTSLPSTGNISLNVTPATEVLTAQTLGMKPASAFVETRHFSNADSVKLQAAKAKLMTALQDTLLALGLDTDAVDLMTSKFAANQQGLDKLLDLVGFSATDGGDINLKDKNSNNTPTVTIPIKDSTKTDPIKITVKVDDKTPLNTTGMDVPIQQLITAFNNKYKSQIDPTYFDEKFLYQGSDKDSFIAYLKNNPEFPSTDYVINSKYKIKKCVQNKDQKNICYVGLQVITQSSQLVTKVVDMGVIQVDSQTWKLYGDQAPFLFSFIPVSVYADVSDNTKVGNGLFLNFTGKACDTCDAIAFNSATIDVSLDGGETYPSRLRFSISSGKATVYSDGITNLNKNNVSVSDTDAQAFNEANLSGKLKIKISAYSPGTQPKVWYPPIYPLLFSSGAEVKDILKQNNWDVVQGLGTRNVSFTGNGILGVLAFFKHPRFSDTLAGFYKPSEITGKQITPLNTSEVCTSFENKSNYFYGSMKCVEFLKDVNIPGVGLMSTDDKGRFILYFKATKQ